MSATRIRVGTEGEIPEGAALMVAIQWKGEDTQAMVYKWAGAIRAFVNQCQHVSYPLDYGRDSGDVFSTEKDKLACPMHGALYDPATGDCTAGPCRGQALEALPVVCEDGVVWLDMAAA